MTTAVQHTLMQGMPARSSSALPTEVIAASVSWAIVVAVKHWLAVPGRPSAQEIVAPVLALIVPMVSQAGAMPSV